MAAHVDTLEQQETLGRPLLVSLVVHAGVFALIGVYAAVSGKVETWGTPNAHGGGSVGVQVTNQIPIPARTGRQNLLANNTKTLAPAPPKPEPKAEKAPDPDAISIRGHEVAKKKPTYIRSNQAQQYQSDQPRSNQLYSHGGAALNSPLFGGQPGSGVGMGPGGALGTRFGAYRDLIEQRISQRWRTDDIDARIRQLPYSVVTFDIRRDGSISSPYISQSSGNRALDYSAQRAVAEAAPFPPLPREYERNSATIEIWFHFQR